MDVLADLIGESPAIEAVRANVRRLVGRQPGGRRLPSVLIQGETGTGKGLVARVLHRAGPRASGPFVDVNCAAIPETLLEAELFGFERGAFTDARRGKPGLFQTAHRGTIFLDEIGLLPEALQAKLLKVIEEQAVRRLGSTESEPVDVWIISATNADLQAAIRGRTFREDLYHRLAVLSLRLPPLRERGADILLLARRFLDQTCAEYGLPPKALAGDAPARLLAYPWPGNVRELSNVIERVALLSEGPTVTGEMLELPRVEPPEASPPRARPAPALSLDDAMGEHLLSVLEQTGWNISRSAALLGISRNTLRARIERLGLRPGATREPPARRAERPRVEPPPRPAAAPGAAAPVRWERRRVTVLRATVAPLGGDDPAPDASRALEVVIDKVVSFGGRVEALSRSGVSASFGLDAIEDAPRRGAHAAMAIRKAAERSRRGAGEGFGIRMGLHVEQVLVGQSGSGAEIDADAKGALSAALDALLAVAEPDSIVVSEGAARFLERRFDLVPLAAREAGSAYRLGGTERPGLGLGGRMARFVGRRRELEILQARLPLVLQGHGQVVALVGEPGVGKSRLVWELTHSSAVQDWLRLETGSVSYATAAAYLPVVELLKRYFQVDAGEDGGRVRDRITARMLALDEALEPMLPPLLALLDVPVEDPRWEALEPSQRRQRTLEAIKRLLLRESRARPVLLVFEDLHWVDAETQAVLDTLAEGLPAARILLCVTYRPEYRHGWGSKSFYTQVRVDPLPRESAEELFHALLGEDPGLGALKPLLLDWTEGNPLFLEESIRTLLETRALVGDRGACRLVKPVPSIQVPATVEAVLAARIDRLSGEDKHLLQCAAVIGTDVPFPLLQAVADLPEEALRRGLARLQAAEFLYEAGVFPKVEYTFRHALTHEVAYGSLLPERRRALHHRIVQALEALAPERAMEQVDALASHALRGEVWDKALLYLRQAGARALGRSANREAAVCFEQALGALGRLPESRERLEQAIDLRFDLRTSLLPLGDHERIFAYLHEAEERATALGDQRRLGRVCTYLTNYFFIAGDQDRALRYGHRALTIAAPLDDVALQVEAELRLGQVHHALGEYRRAVEILTGPVEALAGDLLYERFGLPLIFSVGCRTLLSRSLAELGRFDEGVARGEEAVRIAETVPHPFSLTVAYWGIGHVHLRRGDLEQAVAVLERGLELCRDWSIPVWFPRLASTLGSALVLSGRVAEALPLLEQALEQKLPMRAAGDQSWSLASLSEGYLAAGRPSDAARLAEQARGLARAQRDRGTEAWVERLRGEIAARGAPPDPEAAEGAFRRGLELAEALGMRPLLAHCHLGLARAWAGAGRRAEAEPHRAAAAALYREMAMRLWLAECERL